MMMSPSGDMSVSFLRREDEHTWGKTVYWKRQHGSFFRQSFLELWQEQWWPVYRSHLPEWFPSFLPLFHQMRNCLNREKNCCLSHTGDPSWSASSPGTGYRCFTGGRRGHACGSGSCQYSSLPDAGFWIWLVFWRRKPVLWSAKQRLRYYYRGKRYRAFDRY